MLAMKTMLLIQLVLAMFSIPSYGQQQWQLKIEGGYSLPLSKYSKVDVSKTISNVDGNLLAEYFDKEGHGAAETGSYYAVNVKRLFSNKKFIMSVGFGQGSNTVNTSEISNYYTDFTNDIFYYVFEQNDYEVTYAFLSAGYHHNISKLSLTIEPLIGYSSMRYPNYKLTVYLDATDEFRFDATHRGPTEGIGALMIGIQSAIDFRLIQRLLLGVNLRYLSANYDYTIEPKATGIDSRKRNDTVNYRVFNIGLSLGILL